jgi:hypothetical protein
VVKDNANVTLQKNSTLPFFTYIVVKTYLPPWLFLDERIIVNLKPTTLSRLEEYTNWLT